MLLLTINYHQPELGALHNDWVRNFHKLDDSAQETRNAYDHKTSLQPFPQVDLLLSMSTRTKQHPFDGIGALEPIMLAICVCNISYSYINK